MFLLLIISALNIFCSEPFDDDLFSLKLNERAKIPLPALRTRQGSTSSTVHHERRGHRGGRHLGSRWTGHSRGPSSLSSRKNSRLNSIRLSTLQFEEDFPFNQSLTAEDKNQIDLAIKALEEIFEKADRQGRTAALNLLRLPPELQIHILSYLTPEERADLAKMSKDHQELMNAMKTKLDLSDLQDLNAGLIQTLGRQYPNVRTLIIRDPGNSTGLDMWLVNTIIRAFPELEHVKILDCHYGYSISAINRFIIWKNAKENRTFECLELKRVNREKLFTKRSAKKAV